MKKLERKHIFAVLTVVAVAIIGIGLSSSSSDKRNFEMVKNLDIFFSVFKELNVHYVDDPDPEKLIRTAIDEMLKTLDPYTVYIPEEDMDDFRFMTTGEYGGVGAIISMSDTCYVMVRELYKDYPADEIGLRPGDYFIEIDGKSVKDFKTDQVSDLLRGTPETEVKVKIMRPGEAKPFEKTAVRRKIQINPVTYYGMLDEETGYIALSNFTQNCTEEVEKSFQELKKNGAKKMILDLRSNPGGLLGEAISIVNLFVPQGSTVLSTKGRASFMDKRYTAPRLPIDTVMPMVVMINRSSASASEIVAGALQDLDRAVIVGQRSFGKGLVQSTRDVEHNGSLKLTTAKYYIPSGRCIQALDYSHRDKDGAVGYVPDSLISEFKTKIGRTVYDGGGVSPDIYIEPTKYSNISLALIASDVVFHYAVNYRINHPTIAPAEEFNLTDADYDDFCKYVESYPSFTYRNKSSDALEKLISAAKADKYYDENTALFDNLDEVLKPELKKDLELSRESIKELIEDDILISYYYSKGQIPHALQTDSATLVAISTLKDMDKYNGLLDGTVPSHAGDKREVNKDVKEKDED